MKTVLVIILVCVSICLMATRSVYANDIQLKQFIAPLDCVKQTIDNGVTTEVILTPEECDELLNPTPEPPLNNDTSQPQQPNKSESRRELDSPNTGYFRSLTDMVVANGDYIGIVFFIASAGLIVVGVRRLSRVK